MIRNSSEQAVHNSGSPFIAVNAVAKRSRQLFGGASPLVTNANPEKPAMTAIREIAAGVVQVVPRLLGLSDHADAANRERAVGFFRRHREAQLSPPDLDRVR